MRELLQSIERAFRRIVVYPLLRAIFRNPSSEAPIDLRSVHRILIFRYDRIGDMIVTTPILRALKSAHPGLQLSVWASASNAEILRSNPYVDAVYIFPTNWLKLAGQLLHLRRQHFEVLLNFVFNRTTTPGILANIIAPSGIKVGQGPDRYAFYFNRIAQLPRFQKHMVESLAAFIEEVFGIKLSKDELVFEIASGPESRKHVDEWLGANFLRRRSEPGKPLSPYVVFNLSAVDTERRISSGQAASLAEHLSKRSDFRTVLLWAPGDREMLHVAERSRECSDCLRYTTEPAFPLSQLASLIEGAIAVISPDTSVIHFASAMQTPVLGVYTRLQGMVEWLPHNVCHQLVVAPEGEIAARISHATLIEQTDIFLSRILNAGPKDSGKSS